MDQRIVAFHRDAEEHWVADLECGHTQHVRHDPPWQNRPWVVEEASCMAYVGTILSCPQCDEPPMAQPPSAEGTSLLSLDPYADARLRGLCHDGAAEVARHHRRRSDPKP